MFFFYEDRKKNSGHICLGCMALSICELVCFTDIGIVVLRLGRLKQVKFSWGRKQANYENVSISASVIVRKLEQEQMNK